MSNPSPAPSSGARPPPPKGILKRPSAKSNRAKTKDMVAKLAAEQEPHEQTLLEQAVRQAEILQRLKESGDIREPVPIETFERLSQLPTIRSSDLTAANPAPEDVREFIAAVETFIPSEYDDLIEERNILGNCGYTLCPRPRRNYTGEWKIRPTGIAKVADLNKWCSEKCALRALHIRVQLDNPTYIRRRDPTAGGKVVTVTKIELREEDKPKQNPQQQQQTATPAPPSNPSYSQPNKPNLDAQIESQLPPALQNIHITDSPSQSQTTTRNAALLAAERVGTTSRQAGYSAAARATANLNLNLPILTKNRQQQNSIEVTIQEKEILAPVRAPKQKEDAHLMVEGYRIDKFGLPEDGEGGSTARERLERSGRAAGNNSDEDEDEDILSTLRF